jgi:hypothetical protein
VSNLYNGPESPPTPNPLGTGNIKLTMPTRRPARRQDTAGQASCADPPELVTDSPSSAPADDVTQADPADQAGSDDVRYDPEDGSRSSGFGLDPHIVRVFGVLIGVVALIAGLVWWFSQPTPQPKPAHTIAALPTAGPAVTTTAAAIDQDGPLPITLNAVCPGQTDPKLAASDDHHSGWTCPTMNVPFGQKLVATLPQPYVITGIKFWPGFNGVGHDGRDEWFRHRIMQEVGFVFNDRDLTPLSGSPNGERHEYALVVDHLVASQVEMTVISSVAPPPEPATTPTSAPPGADPSPADAPPDLGSIFPAGPSDTGDGANAPDASSIAVTGFQLIGHPIR